MALSAAPKLDEAEKPLSLNAQAPDVWLFARTAGWLHGGYTVQNPVPLATWWLHEKKKKKPRYLLNSRVSFVYLGWLMGLEPTTTGITILDSTN